MPAIFYYFKCRSKSITSIIQAFWCNFYWKWLSFFLRKRTHEVENSNCISKSNATLKLPLRELFFAVLTPVQIYVVALPTVRFFSVKRASGGAGAF